MLGRAPRADDGNRRVLEECESPAREQDERWIVELQQSLGIAFVPARDHGEVQLFDRIEGTLDPALGGGRYLLIAPCGLERGLRAPVSLRSEEHTSELQSRENLVCRLLLEQTKHRQ